MKNEEKIEKKKKNTARAGFKEYSPRRLFVCNVVLRFQSLRRHTRARRRTSVVNSFAMATGECISQSVYPSSESFSCAAYQWGGRIAANSFACVVVVVGVRNTILHGYGRRRVRRIDAQSRHDR